MKITSYIIVISILINSLIQFGLIFRYYSPLITEYLNNNKTSWNANYDRIILVAITAFFYLNINLGRTLLHSPSELYLEILIMIILIFFTILIYLFQKIGFAKRKLNYINMVSIKEYEEQLNYIEPREYLFFLNTESLETKNEHILKVIEIEPEDITIAANESAETINNSFNHNFHKDQLIYLFNEFKRNEFINADFDKNNFCENFLNGRIKLTKKVTSVNLWHVHHNLIENIKLDSELKLKTFVKFFISFKNQTFKYGGVKNGSQSTYSD